MVRQVLSADEAPSSPMGRMALGEFEGYVSLGVSVLLSVTKFSLGLISGSIALLADAANNLADIGSSLVVALGFRWSRRPRDREHPFGHGRIEAVATLVLSLILIGVAIEVFRAGLRRLMAPEVLEVSRWLLAVVLATVLLKVWLARFAARLAAATGSLTLKADAWNHGFDILSTFLVVLALVSARMGWSRVDGWAGIGVAGFIAWTGLKFALQSAHTLIGEAPAPEDIEAIETAAVSIPGVRGTHDVVLHTYGDIRLVSLHIEVDADLTVLEAHEMAERAEALIAERLGARVVAHVDPVDRTHPAYPKVEAVVRKLVESRSDLVGFHDLRVAGTHAHFHLMVDLVARANRQSSDFPVLLREARAWIRHEVPEAQDVEIGIESELAGDLEHREICRAGGAPGERGDGTEPVSGRAP
ncbi:MAG: cation diffusion facilitator family transporter [Kiritimatiellia bacterium]|nr:cation diffusion facilitator family transporter [Kiritimatiellia bacterium]